MQNIALGAGLTAFSIVLIRYAKSRADAGQRFWRYATHTAWLAVLFTGFFGLGVVAMLGGALDIAGR